MKKHEVRGWIEEAGVIAAVRVFSEEDALFAAQAVAEGGIPGRRNHLNRAQCHPGHLAPGEEPSPNGRGGGRSEEGGNRASVS